MSIATVIADDVGYSSANRNAITGATGTVSLPAGVVSVGSHIRHEQKQNLDITGYGTTLYGVDPLLNTLIINGHENNFGYGQQDGIGWRYQEGGSGEGDNKGFYRGVSERYKGVFPGLTALYTNGKFVQRGQLVSYAKSGRDRILCDVGDFVGGEVVRIADGAGIDEIAPTEWAVIKGVLPDGLVFDRKLKRPYDKNNAIVFGAAVPWPMNITYRGIKFDGSGTGNQSNRLFLSACFRTSFYDCEVTANSVMSAASSSEMLFDGCDLKSQFLINSSQITFRNCRLHSLSAEEWCQYVVLENCIVYPMQLDSKIGCSHWKLTNCRFPGVAAHFYDHWKVTDCKLIGAGDCFVRGTGTHLKRVTSDRAIHVQKSYQGAPQNAGTSVILEAVSAPAIVLAAGTTGKIINCGSTPISGDTSGFKIA